MRSLIEFVAIISLGLVLLALLRRNCRRWTTVAVVLGVFACALALPPAAGAAEIHHEEQMYTLPLGKTVNDDLVVAAQAVNVEGTVDGDLIAFSESLRVSGHVTGDVIAFCKDVHITGQVDGNVRLFVRHLVLEGQVGKNAAIFVDNAELDSKSQIGRNVYLFAGLATLDGRVARGVMAFAGRTQLNGYVGGDFKVRGHHLSIGSPAEVRGKATYKGHFSPQVDPGAKLASPLEVEIIHERPEYASPRHYWHQILLWGAGFLFGLVLLLLMPRFFAEVVHSGDRFGPSLGIGALVLIVTPIAAIIACITLVGLAVGIGTLLLYVIALYSAKCFVGAWLGEKILGVSAGTGPMIGRLALGLFLICIARNLPYLGGLIMSVVLTWGLGALALALYRRTKPLQAAPAAPAPAA
jgi:cytoskeletal protein CcmA (bactofilin family)